MKRLLQIIWATAACLSVGLASALRAGKRAPLQEPPRILIKQYSKVTGGPEALVQLLIACADAGGDCYHFGHHIAPDFQKEYESALLSHGLLERRLTVKNIRANDIVIVPEIGACQSLAEGVFPYIYMLADKNPGPDACPRLAHNHYVASLPGVAARATLTPYISPSVVEHARREAGLESDGGFQHLKALLARKRDLVLVDGDSNVRGQLAAWLPSGLGGLNCSIAFVDAEQSSVALMSAETQQSFSQGPMGRAPPSSASRASPGKSCWS